MKSITMKSWLFVYIFVILFLISTAHVYEVWALSTTDVTLEPDLPSPQPVGTTITWTVTYSGIDPVDYRLSIRFVDDAPDEPLRVMYDFRSNNVFEWTTIEDGDYIIEATVRNLDTGDIIVQLEDYIIMSRVSNRSIVTLTDHPLIALYSTPHPYTEEGYQMLVLFVKQGTLSFTNVKPCRPNHSVNFYIAGMQPESAYLVQHVILDENWNFVELGPQRVCQTGSLPGDIEFPEMTVLDPPDIQSSLLEKVLLLAWKGSEEGGLAINLVGEVIWYNLGGSLQNPVAGGTFLMKAPDGELREVDLAGNIVRETTVPRVREQLIDMGYPQDDVIGPWLKSFHHEARRLPNGYTVLLGKGEKIYYGVQGAEPDEPIDILGDYIFVLDENWQLVWAWDSFDEVNGFGEYINRTAVLDEKKSPGTLINPLTEEPFETMNDWMHSNSVSYSPVDGNLIVSVRHHDWVVKVDYQDGAGGGHVIWRLGPEGDFAIVSGDPWPWFSHTHDAKYVSENQIIVYDNGNTRHVDQPVAHSRGQAYAIDEVNMVAILTLNADLGDYSRAVGSAQQLMNGNFHFNSGALGAKPDDYSTSDEVLPHNGRKTYSIKIGDKVYRSFRMRNLYMPPSGKVSLEKINQLLSLFE